MTISVGGAARVSYAGNGVTVAFTTPQSLANADIVATLVVDATGVETLQVLTTNYTLTGAGAASGTLTMLVTPPTGTTLVIYTDPEISQNVDLVNGDPLDVNTEIETPLDKLTLLYRRARDLVKRSIRLPEGDTGFVEADTFLPAKVTRASKYLAFDVNGKPIATAGTTDATVHSTFIATLHDDTSAAQARTTLGAADDAAVVHLAGTETITGAKTFTANQIINTATPTLILKESGAAVDEGLWFLYVDAATFSIFTATDAGAGIARGLYVARTGTAITDTKVSGLTVGAPTGGYTAGEVNAAAGVKDNGNRVYSASNPPFTTWQTVTRALATPYQNLTGKPIQVAIYTSIPVAGSGGVTNTFKVGSASPSFTVMSAAPGGSGVPVEMYVYAIIPENHYYQLDGNAFTSWTELR